MMIYHDKCVVTEKSRRVVQVEELTKKYSKSIDETCKNKEREIMS